MAGWRNALRTWKSGERRLFPGRSCGWIALRTARSALAGTALLQHGNRPFDAPAVVFAHDQFVSNTWEQNPA